MQTRTLSILLFVVAVAVLGSCDDTAGIGTSPGPQAAQPARFVVNVDALQDSPTVTRLIFSYDRPTVDTETEDIGISMGVETTYVITKEQYTDWIITRGDFDIATVGRISSLDHRIVIRQICERDLIGKIHEYGSDPDVIQFDYIPSDAELVSDLKGKADEYERL